MSRPKSQDDKLLLNHVLRIRIDQATLEKLQKIVKDSDCRNPCAAARKILSGERINIFYRDDSMTGVMEELALIRKEIRSIGININQQTHHFHTAASASEKWFYVHRTLTQYKLIKDKIELLLEIVNKLSRKWLQG